MHQTIIIGTLRPQTSDRTIQVLIPSFSVFFYPLSVFSLVPSVMNVINPKEAILFLRGGLVYVDKSVKKVHALADECIENASYKEISNLTDFRMVRS